MATRRARPARSSGWASPTGFTYTYDPTAADGSHITGMLLDGDGRSTRPRRYSVTVNSFLATGGDNFLELANGTNKRDTGQVDLQAMVDYMAAKTPVPVNVGQRSVGVDFPDGCTGRPTRAATPWRSRCPR